MVESQYNSQALRRFVGIVLGREAIPDRTTLCNFGIFVVQNGVGEKVFEQVWKPQEANGFSVSRGIIVYATIITAPPSTKSNNKDKGCDPEMHQTKNGNRRRFGNDQS